MLGRLRPYLLALLVVAAATVPYARTLDFKFAWDDGFLIGPQLDVHGPGDLARLWNLPFDNLLKDEVMARTYFRPATLYSLALDRALHGSNPRGFHLTNIVLYAGVCLFLWLLAWEISGRPIAAAIGAVLFALHPTHPESVAFISGRTDVIAGLFLFAAFWVAARFGPAIEDARWKLLPAALVLVPGLLAKEVALFGAPLLVLALAVRERGLGVRRLAIAALPVAAVSVLYLAIRFAVLASNPMPAVTPVEGTVAQVLTSVAVVARYLPLLFAPLRLSARHEIVEVHRPDLVFAAGLAALAAMAVGCWVLIRKRSPWSLPLALFAATLVPICYVRLLSGAIVAERFLFVPSGAIALAVALLPGVLPRRAAAASHRSAAPRDAGAAFALVAGAIAVGLASLLGPRVAVWEDDGVLFRSMLRDSPESPHIHAIVGGWYYREHDYERSAFHYRRAIRYAPERAGELLFHLGAAEYDMGAIDSAFVHVRAMNALRPDFGQGWFALGNLYLKVNQPDSAMAAYRKALQFSPNFAQAENNIGAILERAGKYEEALAAYRRAVAALPGFADAQNNLRRLSAEMGRPEGLDSTP
ncbi:MAG TPA: tetratricopeptide repeat protein [Candidatus Eisenbacteria bacterium]|nr:tetratricopeptide repeat protein [Candidatus Eisenbacteria bacterium]